MRSKIHGAAAAALLAALLGPTLAKADCTTTIGVVMELTGPAGEYGQKASKAVELAVKDINDAGGAAGCTLALDIRDAQSQGSVAADVAKQLVEIKKVPVIIGGIISSVSMPILTSVTAPAGVVQISPASSAAKYALDLGFKKLAIVHVNNDFGVNMVKEFSKAYLALGGTIVSTTPYNENQPSYGPEVTKALAGKPDALYLVSTPGDGATIARNWISQGGVKKFLLNDGMNSEEFIKNVGAQYLEEAYGTSSGADKSTSTDYFANAFKAYSGFDWQAPAADRSYDATAIAALAIAQAGKAEPAAIRDSIRKVLDPNGTVIYAGAEQFKKGLALIKDGKPIRYVGVIGAVQFDKNGDITGPFRLWRIQKGEVVTTGDVPTDKVDELISKVNK
jgi:ABC-type branched-subunit amino acid transport system substrate-binding protein